MIKPFMIQHHCIIMLNQTNLSNMIFFMMLRFLLMEICLSFRFLFLEVVPVIVLLLCYFNEEVSFIIMECPQGKVDCSLDCSVKCVRIGYLPP